jgi:hypothetical protein
MDKETQMQGGKMSELEKMGGKEFYSIFVKAIESFTFGEMKYDEFIILDRALLSRLERGERAIEAMGRIADIVHNYSCHSSAEAYARITEIVMDNERPREDRNDT